jgi:inosine-uridine nucleoside N-ribohydrolase
MTRIVLDTDLGSDTDDLCALAMLLGWAGAELVGVTTSTDPGGIRAGFVRYALELVGRTDVAVAAGAEGPLGSFIVPLAFPDYWPEPIEPRPGLPGAAVDLLAEAAASGDTIVSVGPYTNLALLEAARPGLLAGTTVAVMGGHQTRPREGLPPWGMRDDVNVQQDAVAAKLVFERVRPIVVPLAACLEARLRRAHLDELRDAGALGTLIADQAEAHARDNGREELGRAYDALPDDLLNLHYDPLACAVALRWDGVEIEDLPCALTLRPDGLLEMTPHAGSPALRTVTAVRGERFERAWLDAVVRASRGAP